MPRELNPTGKDMLAWGMRAAMSPLGGARSLRPLELGRLNLRGRPILVSETRQLGDTLFCLPLLKSLRLSFPDSEITFLGANPYLELAASAQPDHLWGVEPGSLARPGELLRLARRLAAKKFQAALVLEFHARHSLLPWLAGIPWRLGLIPQLSRRQGDSRPRFTFLLNGLLPMEPARQHRVEDLLCLAPALGGRRLERRALLRPKAVWRSQALALLRQHGLDNGAPLVACNPGARLSSNRWPLERYLEVLLGLRRSGAKVILLSDAQAGPGLGQACQAAGFAPDLLLAGEPLPVVAALLQDCGLYLGTDSGALHLAAFSGAPCLALFGSTQACFTGPWGTGHRVISSPRPCPPESCDRERCARSLCLEAIEAAPVLAAARQMLGVRARDGQRLSA